MKRIYLIGLIFLFAYCKKDSVTEETNTPGTTQTPGTQTPGGNNPPPAGTNNPTGVMKLLPQRIAFGVESDISQNANIIQEVDYRYHYLTGDLFSDNWTNWNSPSGEYARIFLQQTSQMNKVPVFTYYMLVAARYRFEDPAKTNLNDSEVMFKCFENWKFLLELCKQYGKTVIIHYEPDVMGYMQFDPESYTNRVKVAGSNYPDAQGYSNDPKGLFQTIVAMRDKYAPNVLLGWHASQWATRQDLIRNKANPEELATKTAAYYKSLQAPFDLLFSEFSDRDAGFYEARGDANAWWSTQATSANGNLSDFDRFQRYLKKLHQETSQKIILWQIPIGNTLTKTCNNTPNHYKDNRPEYFLQPVIQNGSMDRIRQYGDAGVIAFLFGAGEGSCTNYVDSPRDGVTGSGELADNDGGYLRKGIKAYYDEGPIAVN